MDLAHLFMTSAVKILLFQYQHTNVMKRLHLRVRVEMKTGLAII